MAGARRFVADTASTVTARPQGRPVPSERTPSPETRRAASGVPPLSAPLERERADNERPVRGPALDPVPGLDVPQPLHREVRLGALLAEDDRAVHPAEEALDRRFRKGARLE